MNTLAIALALVAGGLLYAPQRLRKAADPGLMLLVGGAFYAAFVAVALVSIR